MATLAAISAAAAILALVPPAGSPAALDIGGDPLVVDRHTGLAIGGFDPIAYFTEGRPAAGSEEHELRFGRAVWRFRNVGNRAAFEARPDVYAPRFGGYDPVAASRGLTVAGNPLLWTISGERLYLFYSRKALAAFTADPVRVIAAAERKWPDIVRTFTP
jgi:hypothetical protein